MKIWTFTILGAVTGIVLDYFGQWNPWSYGAALLLMVINAVWDEYNAR